MFPLFYCLSNQHTVPTCIYYDQHSILWGIELSCKSELFKDIFDKVRAEPLSDFGHVLYATICLEFTMEHYSDISDKIHKTHLLSSFDFRLFTNASLGWVKAYKVI